VISCHWLCSCLDVQMSRFKQIDDIDVADDFVLPEGNVVRGQLLFKKHCAQCHTIRRDGSNPYGMLVGPNLYGVMGRTAAMNQRSGWVKHSQKLEASGILWTERNMMAFLKNPRAFAGGAINMNFRGVEGWQDRVDIIHYLQRAGHESWMVQDGTPHSQKQWWKRGVSGPTKNYWEVNESKKNIKPWQHMWRSASKKVEDAKLDMMTSLGLHDPAKEAAKAAALAEAEEKDDRETQTWLRVREVQDGVQSASMQRSYSWPPLEVIQAGPERKKRAGPAIPAPGPPPSPPPGEPIFVPTLVAACEEPPVSRHAAQGVRAPSGLMVYSESGGPAAAAAPSSAPPSSARVVIPQPRPPEGPPRKDGGIVTPGGLILYKCNP